MDSNSKMGSKFKNGQLTLVGPIFGELQNCPPILLFLGPGELPKGGPKWCIHYQQAISHRRRKQPIVVLNALSCTKFVCVLSGGVLICEISASVSARKIHVKITRFQFTKSVIWAQHICTRLVGIIFVISSSCYFIHPDPLTVPSSCLVNCAAFLSTEVCSV